MANHTVLTVLLLLSLLSFSFCKPIPNSRRGQRNSHKRKSRYVGENNPAELRSLIKKDALERDLEPNEKDDYYPDGYHMPAPLRPIVPHLTTGDATGAFEIADSVPGAVYSLPQPRVARAPLVDRMPWDVPTLVHPNDCTSNSFTLDVAALRLSWAERERTNGGTATGPFTYNPGDDVRAPVTTAPCKFRLVKRYIERRSSGTAQEGALFEDVRDRNGPVILVFRGSSTHSSLETVKDWVTNFNAFPVKCKFGGRTVGRCHKGFKNAWDNINGEFDIIHDVIRATGHGKRKLVIAGTSLGAAVATIAAVHIIKTTRIRPYVSTHGSPRVGNSDFVRAFDLGVKSSRRIYSFTTCHSSEPLYRRTDLITRVPPRGMGFEHVKGGMAIPCHAACEKRVQKSSFVQFIEKIANAAKEVFSSMPVEGVSYESGVKVKEESLVTLCVKCHFRYTTDLWAYYDQYMSHKYSMIQT